MFDQSWATCALDDVPSHVPLRHHSKRTPRHIGWSHNYLGNISRDILRFWNQASTLWLCKRNCLVCELEAGKRHSLSLDKLMHASPTSQSSGTTSWCEKTFKICRDLPTQFATSVATSSRAGPLGSPLFTVGSTTPVIAATPHT